MDLSTRSASSFLIIKLNDEASTENGRDKVLKDLKAKTWKAFAKVLVNALTCKLSSYDSISLT